MSRRGLFWRSLAVYVLVGPIIGGWIALAIFLAPSLPSGIAQVAHGSLSLGAVSWVSILLSPLFLLIGIFPENYFFGLVPALIGGVVVAVKDAYYGGARFAFALATGLGVGLLVVAFCWAVSAGISFGLILAAVCVLSSLACWRLTRGMVARSGFAT